MPRKDISMSKVFKINTLRRLSSYDMSYFSNEGIYLLLVSPVSINVYMRMMFLYDVNLTANAIPL